MRTILATICRCIRLDWHDIICPSIWSLNHPRSLHWHNILVEVTVLEIQRADLKHVSHIDCICCAHHLNPVASTGGCTGHVNCQSSRIHLPGAPSDPWIFNGRQCRSYNPGLTCDRSKPSTMPVPCRAFEMSNLTLFA